LPEVSLDDVVEIGPDAIRRANLKKVMLEPKIPLKDSKKPNMLDKYDLSELRNSNKVYNLITFCRKNESG